MEDLILLGRYNRILIYSVKFHNACFLSLGQKCSNLFLKKKKKKASNPKFYIRLQKTINSAN